MNGGEPLGYLVAISRKSGLILPSFTEVYDTPEEAAEELDRLTGILQLPPGEKLITLEVRECEE